MKNTTSAKQEDAAWFMISAFIVSEVPSSQGMSDSNCSPSATA